MKRGFDWIRFFRSYGIEYVDTGKNVKKGEVNTKCPLCGPRDPSEHLGFNLESSKYACWRDSTHRGSSPVRLIRAFLKISVREAIEIAGVEIDAPLEPLDELSARLEALEDDFVRSPDLRALRLPKALRKVSEDVLFGRFYRYLESRGFSRRDIPKVIDLYDLRCASTGEQRFRLVFPIKIRGAIVGWSGRAITSTAEIRYKTYPTGDDAVGPRIILNYDEAARKPGRILQVVEGPLDVAKLDFYGKRHGVRAVGTLGLDLSPSKVSLIASLSDLYDQVLVLFDNSAEKQTLDAVERLSFLGAEVSPKPPGFDDPGALTAREVSSFSKSLVSKFL